MPEQDEMTGSCLRSTAPTLWNTFPGDVPVLQIVGKAFNEDLVAEDDRVLKRAAMMITIPGMVLLPTK